MDDLSKFYLARAERALIANRGFDEKEKSTTIIADVMKRVKAIVGPRNVPPVKQAELATEALEALRDGERPSALSLAALEFVIRSMRPVPLSRGGQLDPLHDDVAPAFPHWQQFCASVKPYLYSIGRIDLLPKEGVGTGFLVAAGLLVTNKHVLDVLSRGTGRLEKNQAVVRFKYEYGSGGDEEEIPLLGLVAVHPTLDLALLEVETQAFSAGRQPLVLDSTLATEGAAVVAIGYPFDDSQRNPLFINALFENQFGVKRAAPGEIAGLAPQALHHDCSTVGGNSGSPILSMETARVIGIHRDGYFLYRNEAVNGASLVEFVQPHLN